MNPATAAFCGRCGGSLGSFSICPDCGHQNRIDHNFCSGCGARLAESAPAGGEESATGPAPGLSSLVAELTTAAKRTERRQLTVAFCDLVGSTELSRKLDPEDLRHALRSFQETCSEVVKRFDGYIAQYLGDGVLIYFGYPLAHEDDPVRAISASLGIIGELPRLNRRLEKRIGALSNRPLAVRIGVHTGLVVVGEVGGPGQAQELQAQGETPNIAARLQSAAQPDTVVMSETTRRLVTGVFIMEDLGELTVKGVADPLRAYRAVQASGVRSRLDLAGAYGLTPLVGRQEELDLLLEYWRHAREREGQVMLLSGDAGVGKSRLVQTFRDRLSEDAHSWLECRCSPLYSQSAFSPVVDLIQQGLLISRGDSPETKLAKLETGLENAGFDLAEAVPLFADLLSVPIGEGYQPLALSPEARRQKLLTALARWLFVLAELQPVILVVEDLHWVDPSTMTLLESMMTQAPSSAVLMLLTFRTGFEPPSIHRSRSTRISLKTLTPNQIRAMVSSMVGGKTLPREVLDELVAKTDGVPLFVEELTK
ncbi:MAG: AAA family ATPase, partial [Thermoanaerobaculia bacterium]|nr:AAA family ATPase [Thermoanaerobaculia bacterium]